MDETTEIKAGVEIAYGRRVFKVLGPAPHKGMWRIHERIRRGYRAPAGWKPKLYDMPEDDLVQIARESLRHERLMEQMSSHAQGRRAGAKRSAKVPGKNSRPGTIRGLERAYYSAHGFAT
ncbi:MAG: hypothetical protein KGI59_02395 [Patescibacteria group bacterium]|nr:hypothetical protein [Patescibacteria group bacterium]MDE2172377.1 hypothetical protein [Patescibacteria group bacterium]